MTATANKLIACLGNSQIHIALSHESSPIARKQDLARWLHKGNSDA